MDVTFELCYYGHQLWDSVLEMDMYDIEWMHKKLDKTKKEELETLKGKHR